MTFNAAIQRRAHQRFKPKKSQSSSRSLLPVKARRVQPGRHKYSPKFFLAMAVSIISSIGFLRVLFLVIMSG